jgi:hypothetical protein
MGGKSTAQRSWEYRERKKQREEAAKVAAVNECKDQKAWWAKNKTENPPTAEALALHERCLDLICWMRTGHEIDLSDSCYVDLKEGTADLLEFVREHPGPHLGYAVRNQDIPSDWSTGVWHNDKKYWHDESLLQMLTNEGPATECYVKFGLLQGLPDSTVINFLMERAGFPFDKAIEVVGQTAVVIDGRTTVVYK